jgi:Ca2+-binding EF-hand superfamily protein
MTSHKLSSRWVGFAFGVAGVTGFALLPSVAAAGNPETRFETMDDNDDGKISPDEHFAAASRMFDKMDTNADGKVTAAEMTAAHQKVTGKKAHKSDLTAAEKIKLLDTDSDGVLTSEEHAAGARSMFDKMDTDKDGTLSKAELKAGHDKMLHKTSAPPPATKSGTGD